MTDEAARPAILDEVPYFGLMDSPNAASAPRNDHRPTMLTLPEALKLAADIGDGRIKHMDEHGIQMQVVSYGSLAQLTPGDQAMALTQAANNRLAEAIAANPARLSGFAVLSITRPRPGRRDRRRRAPRHRRNDTDSRRPAELPQDRRRPLTTADHGARHGTA